MKRGRVFFSVLITLVGLNACQSFRYGASPRSSVYSASLNSEFESYDPPPEDKIGTYIFVGIATAAAIGAAVAVPWYLHDKL